jgi:putative transposase
MKKPRYSVEQIVAILNQAELGMPVADLVRKVGISEQTFYRWKKQYDGLDSTQVREFKQLSEENARLKKLVADLSLDKAVLQDVLSKKFPVHRQERFMPKQRNEVWSLDFVQDQFSNGEKFRTLTIVDVFSREALAIEVGQRLRGENVVEVLNRLVKARGAP